MHVGPPPAFDKTDQLPLGNDSPATDTCPLRDMSPIGQEETSDSQLMAR